jgi:hypothetical protein
MITINKLFANTALPVDLPLTDRIKALPGLAAWFQANAALNTVSGGKVSELADKAGGLAVLTQGTTGQRGTWTENAFGAYPGVMLDGVDDEYLLSGLTPDTNADFTWAVICKGTPAAASAHILSNYAATNDGSWMGFDASNRLRAHHGNADLTGPYTPGARAVVVMGKSGGTLSARFNGGATQTAATDNNGSNATLRVGRLNSGGSQPFPGGFSDILLFSSNLFSDVKQVQLIETFAAMVYGVTLG